MLEDGILRDGVQQCQYNAKKQELARREIVQAHHKHVALDLAKLVVCDTFRGQFRGSGCRCAPNRVIFKSTTWRTIHIRCQMPRRGCTERIGEETRRSQGRCKDRVCFWSLDARLEGTLGYDCVTGNKCCKFLNRRGHSKDGRATANGETGW